MEIETRKDIVSLRTPPLWITDRKGMSAEEAESAAACLREQGCTLRFLEVDNFGYSLLADPDTPFFEKSLVFYRNAIICAARLGAEGAILTFSGGCFDRGPVGQRASAKVMLANILETAKKSGVRLFIKAGEYPDSVLFVTKQEIIGLAAELPGLCVWKDRDVR